MENLYKKDKVVALSYMAAERNITITYRSQTEEARRESAASRKRQRQNHLFTDDNSELGPPDKRKNFKTKPSKIKIGQWVAVKYDDDIWYKGTLIEYHNQTDEWVALFDADGHVIRQALIFQMKMYVCCDWDTLQH